MSDNQQNATAAVTIGFIAGAVVGAALGLLFAPRSGRETRALLADKAGEAKEKVVDLAYDIEDRAAIVVDKLKETAAEIKRNPVNPEK